MYYYFCPEHNMPIYGSSRGIVTINLVNHLLAAHDMTLQEATDEAKRRLVVAEDNES